MEREDCSSCWRTLGRFHSQFLLINCELLKIKFNANCEIQVYYKLIKCVWQDSTGAEQAEVLRHGPAAAPRVLREDGGPGGQVRPGRHRQRDVHAAVRLPPALRGCRRYFLHGRSPRVLR